MKEKDVLNESRVTAILWRKRERLSESQLEIRSALLLRFDAMQMGGDSDVH